MTKKIIIKEVKNSGVIIENVRPENYSTDLTIGGTLSPLDPPSIIFPDGHGHLKYQGAPEMQFNRNFDTFSCVIFTIAKAICYNLKERYNIDITISEMFNAYYAGVRAGIGTTINNGMESFRTKGWVEDKDYPFTINTTLQQFQQCPPIAIVNKATGQLTKWKFNWEAIGKDHDSIIEALKRTVVVLTGFAWASYYGEGVYYDYNNQANHAFLGGDYKVNGNYLIDDSYPRDNRFDDDSTPDEFIKELDKSFKFGSAHRVWLTPILPFPKNLSLINIIKNMFIKICRSVKGALYFIKDGKKQEINDWLDFAGAVIDEVGCKTIKDEDLAKLPDFKFFGK
jgi:hypothetical protein